MNPVDTPISMLLIEDDTVDIQDIKRIFQKNKLVNPLHIARNGLEALNMLAGKQGENKLDPTPKIIILDINMPKMNGIEFLKVLRADPALASILVFVLTSSDEDKDKMAAYNLKVAGYIIKPIQFTEFIAAVSTLSYHSGLLKFSP